MAEGARRYAAPMNRVRLALMQIDTVVGDLPGNVDRIRRRLDQVADCDLALFPEMAITGYPLEDLSLIHI